MLFKSKSVITVIGLGLFALVCVIAGALILNSPDITEFSTDGYILSASAEEGAENVMVSEQIWFGQGSSWKEKKKFVFRMHREILCRFRQTALSIIQIIHSQQ